MEDGSSIEELNYTEKEKPYLKEDVLPTLCSLNP